MSKKPYFTDRCEHLSKDRGVFVGSTVFPINGKPIDVYIWKDTRGKRELCLRYGENGEQYMSPFGTPEEWSDPNRMTQDGMGDMVPASCFDGPAMELVRAFLEREKSR